MGILKGEVREDLIQKHPVSSIWGESKAGGDPGGRVQAQGRAVVKGLGKEPALCPEAGPKPLFHRNSLGPADSGESWVWQLVGMARGFPKADPWDSRVHIGVMFFEGNVKKYCFDSVSLFLQLFSFFHVRILSIWKLQVISVQGLEDIWRRGK